MIETSFGSGSWGNWSAAYWKAMTNFMQPIVNAIRNTGATNIILVPSLCWQQDNSGWASYPISGLNVGYSAHLYPGWGNVGVNDTNGINSYLNSTYKPCSDKYPLFITEMNWSGSSGDGTTAGFGNAVKSWCDTQGNMSWVAGMLGDVLGNLSAGLNNTTLSSEDSGKAAFAWWPTYTGSAPSGGGLANGTYKLVARNSGKALDAYGNQTTNGTTIIQWTYGGGSNQKWTLTDTGSGKYKIIGVQSGKALDIYNNQTANGTKVELWTYGGGNNQLFTFTATDSGYYRVTPQNATGSCLDVTGNSTADGATVVLWTWNGGNNQQWAPQAP
jgi:hypothetical protein